MPLRCGDKKCSLFSSKTKIESSSTDKSPLVESVQKLTFTPTNNQNKDMSFEGKVAIITGSSSGIGQAVAEQLATKGASVTVHGQTKERLDKTVELLKKQGVAESKILAVLGPIEKEEIQKKLIDETVKKFGKLDILVNNAGISNRKDLETNSLENFDYVMDANLKSVFALTKLAAPHLAKAKGNVVNVSSIGGQKAYPFNIPYVLTKAGMDHLTRNQALQYANQGIRVNTVSPGGTDTNFGANSQMNKDQMEAMIKGFMEICPLHRFATSHEVANVVVFLASELASYVTGSNYVVDGGVLCGNALPKTEGQ